MDSHYTAEAFLARVLRLFPHLELREAKRLAWNLALFQFRADFPAPRR